LPSFTPTTIISGVIGKTSGTYDDLLKDHLLQVSRRLDWRFLLPNPDLDDVAYLGPENDPLVEALLIFCRSLTQIMSVLVPSKDSKEFDLVVVKNPSIQALDLGAKLIKPGGYLYIEAYSWSRLVKPQQLGKFFHDLLQQSAGSTRLWFPTHYERVIRKLGFQTIHTYWHWPNFESCTRIIALDDTDSQILAFSIQENGIQLYLKKALLLGLFRPRWVQYWVPYFGIIARKDSL
jgi:hypothetical protein